MAKTIIIFGIHAVMAALDHHPENILNLYCQERSDDRFKQLCESAKAAGIHPQYRTRVQIDKLVQSSHHQGVAAEIRLKQMSDERALYSWVEATDQSFLFLILEGIQDPHNLGACLRSAEALGVNWVIIPKSQSVPLNATVSKVACGADQTLSIVEASNLVRVMEHLKALGVWIVGTSGEAEKTIAQVDLTRKVALVMGTEDKGLKRLSLATCDEVAKIPLVGSVSSLNVSVATGICLYEAVRQREILFS